MNKIPIFCICLLCDQIGESSGFIGHQIEIRQAIRLSLADSPIATTIIGKLVLSPFW